MSRGDERWIDDDQRGGDSRGELGAGQPSGDGPEQPRDPHEQETLYGFDRQSRPTTSVQDASQKPELQRWPERLGPPLGTGGDRHRSVPVHALVTEEAARLRAMGDPQETSLDGQRDRQTDDNAESRALARRAAGGELEHAGIVAQGHPRDQTAGVARTLRGRMERCGAMAAAGGTPSCGALSWWF